MKNKDLIKQLQKLDPEKEVMIQQGEEYDYITAHAVKEKKLIDMDTPEQDVVSVIVIEYV
jgi:hypothetical protein